MSDDKITMTSAVFIEASGVVHARQFTPRTLCGQWIIGLGGRTCQLGEGLPLSRLTVLPAVSCLECIAMEMS